MYAQEVLGVSVFRFIMHHADLGGRTVEAEDLSDLPLIHAAHSAEQFDALSNNMTAQIISVSCIYMHSYF